MIVPLLLALALQLPASSGEIRGTVLGTREGGHVPLPYALVEISAPEGSRTVMADSAGRYVLASVPAGLRRVKAQYLGYGETLIEVLVPAGVSVPVDVVLSPKPVELPGLLVTSETFRIPEADAAVRDRDVGRAGAEIALRVLEATPGFAETGLGEAARRLPGNDPADPTDVLFMRGSTADLKLVLLDGAPVYTPFHLGGLIKSFDAVALGSATHHVGGAPARYDGGLSYILDLATRAPTKGPFRTEGALDLMSARIMAEGPLGPHAGVLVSSRALHGLESRLVGGGAAPYGYVDGLARAEVDFGRHRIAFTAFGNQESVRLSLKEAREGSSPDASPGTPPTALPEEASWGNGALSLRYAGTFGRTSVDVAAATTRYRAELPFPLPDTTPRPPSAGPPEAILAWGETERLRFSAEAQRPLSAGSLRLGASVDGLRTDVSAWRLPGGTGSPFGYHTQAAGGVLGAYLDGTQRLAPEVALRYGVRVDRFSPGGTRSALRLALLWTLREDALLTLAGGRYHQLSRGTDSDVDLQMGDGTLTGTGGVPAAGGTGSLLSVARSDHLVLSLDQRLTPAVRLTLEGFFKHFGDLSSVREEDLNASGIDLRLLREGSRLTGWLGYSLSWFWENPDALGRSDDFAGRHMLTAGVRGRPLAGWGTDLQIAYSEGLPLTSIPFSRSVGEAAAHTDGTYTTRPHVPPGPATDAFLRVDAEVSADFQPDFRGRSLRIRPYLRVLNALDRRDALFYYFEPWRDPELRPLAELSVIPILGVEWRF